MAEVAELMGPGMLPCATTRTAQNSLLMRSTECTPKALTHRLAKLRGLAKAGPADATTQDVHKETSTTKSTGKAAGGNGGGKKKAAASNGGGRKKQTAARTPSPIANDDDDDEVLNGNGAPNTPPPSARPKRGGSAKRNYAQLAGEENGSDDDEGEDGLGKKVKIEVGEDIGEGLRQSNEFEEAMMDGAGIFE